MKQPHELDLDLEEGQAPRPMVYVRWCDAVSNANGWSSEEEAIDWAESVEWLTETVGWIMKETKEYLLIASQRGAYKDCLYDYGMLLKIPKTWIKLRVELTEHI